MRKALAGLSEKKENDMAKFTKGSKTVEPPMKKSPFPQPLRAPQAPPMKMGNPNARMGSQGIQGVGPTKKKGK
jgi:hypothetical protein